MWFYQVCFLLGLGGVFEIIIVIFGIGHSLNRFVNSHSTCMLYAITVYQSLLSFQVSEVCGLLITEF
ncbi:hypothetical protein TUM17382_37700 [Shewanella algae]|nr:hypothetical protein TUM17382_37700 [Shewanella algae]